MDWFKGFFFFVDIIEDIKDLIKVMIDKEEKILWKILFVLMTIMGIYISAKIWL